MEKNLENLFKIDFEKATSKELIELFRSVNQVNQDPDEDPSVTFAKAFTLGKSTQEFDNGKNAILCQYIGYNLGSIIVELDEGKGLSISDYKNGIGYVITKGDITKNKNGQITHLHGDEISLYDPKMNLLTKVSYHDDDSREVQSFKNGKITSTAFYDKENKLIKKINKKGDDERRKTSDNIDELNQMAPSSLRQRLKRAQVKEYRQTHPKMKQRSER